MNKRTLAYLILGIISLLVCLALVVVMVLDRGEVAAYKDADGHVLTKTSMRTEQEQKQQIATLAIALASAVCALTAFAVVFVTIVKRREKEEMQALAEWEAAVALAPPEARE